VLKSPDVAGNFIVVVLASTSHEKIAIGAGDAQSTSAKPVSVSSDQASRKSTDEADVAICKQEATSSNVGDAECSRHESDSASLSETLSQSPAVNDTVFYTPPSYISDSETTSDIVSPCQQQSNLHSLVDSLKAPSELKLLVYKRSDSSVGGERRGTDSECSQDVVNAQQRADEVDHYSEGRESVKSEEPLETGDSRDIDIGDDSDSDDDDLSEEKADEMQDYSAADENVATEHQENRSETSMSSTARKRKKRKKKKNNKQQVKPTVVAKSVSSNVVTSETDNLDSLQIKRPPPVRHLETTDTDGDTENKCAQNATSAGSRAASRTVESTEHSVTSHPLEEDVDNTSRSQLSLTDTLPPTDADSEVGGADDAVSHQRNQDADKHSEQKDLKSGAVGSDSANVSHNVRSHRKLKAKKGTGGDENSKRENSEETCEQKLMNADRDSGNKAAQSDRSMQLQNRTSDTKANNTSDAASEGSSNPEVSTYCIFDTAQCCKTSTFISITDYFTK